VVDDKDSQQSRSPDTAGSDPEPTALMAVGELRGEVPAEIRDVSFPGEVLEELRQMAAELEQLASERPAPAHVAADETVELPATLPAPPAEEAKVRRLPRSARGPS
jgi:hypothetical protein